MSPRSHWPAGQRRCAGGAQEVAIAVRLTIHYDNLAGLARPQLRLWHAGANPVDLAPTGGDGFGPLWGLSLVRPELTFTFTASPGAAQGDGHDRRVRPLVRADGGLDPGQVWCRGDRAFAYPVRPADPQPEPGGDLLGRLAADPGFSAGLELPSAGEEYRFWVQGGTPPEDAAGGRLVVDPYARQLGPGAQRRNAVVVDPTSFAWSDRGWRTPDPADLILYEVSVHGFTDGDPDVRPDQQGRFDGITGRIRTGYFDSLGTRGMGRACRFKDCCFSRPCRNLRFDHCEVLRNDPGMVVRSSPAS